MAYIVRKIIALVMIVVCLIMIAWHYTPATPKQVEQPTMQAKASPEATAIVADRLRGTPSPSLAQLRQIEKDVDEALVTRANTKTPARTPEEGAKLAEAVNTPTRPPFGIAGTTPMSLIYMSISIICGAIGLHVIRKSAK